MSKKKLYIFSLVTLLTLPLYSLKNHNYCDFYADGTINEVQFDIPAINLLSVPITNQYRLKNMYGGKGGSARTIFCRRSNLF